MAFVKISSNKIEDVIDVRVRVYYLTLTIFLAELVDNYSIELEDYAKKNGMYVKKRKHHINEIRKNIRMWINDKYSSVTKEYKSFLLDQIDEVQEKLNMDFKVFQFSMKSFLDRYIDNGVETQAITLASMVLNAASFFQIKEEQFCELVSSKLECYYKKRDSYIANTARHSALFIQTFETQKDIDIQQSDDIKKAWDILDYKLSNICIELTDKK